MRPIYALACLAVCAAALEPAVTKPRGFQAAYELEKGVALQQQSPAPSRPPQQQLQRQPPQPQQQRAQAVAGACPAPAQLGLSGCRPSPALWALVGLAAAALFAGGVAVGAAWRGPAALGPQQQAAHPAAPVRAGPREAKAGPAGAPQAAMASSTAEPKPMPTGSAAAAAAAAATSSISKGAGEAGSQAGVQVAAAEGDSDEQPAATPAAATASVAAAAGGVGVEAGGEETCSGGSSEPLPSPHDLLQLQSVVLGAQQQQQEQQQQQQPSAGGSAARSGLGEPACSQLAAAGESGSDGGGGGQSQLSALIPDEDREEIAAAGALVVELTRSLQIDVGALNSGERLQLLHTVLAAWQGQQAKRHSEVMTRLGSEANVLRGSQRDIAAARMSHEVHRDAHALAAERAAAFRRACADTLSFGLALMLAAAAYQAARGGGAAAAAAAMFARCGAWPAPRSSWGLMWHGWGGLRTAACYLGTAWDAALGVAVLLAAPWAVYRTGLLSGGAARAMPLTRLLAGLGLACGAAGYVAVGKVGGSAPVWLAAWEAWVVLQVAFSVLAQRIFRVSLRTAEAAGSGSGLAAMYERSSAWAYAAMWVLTGVLLPLAAGVLPFRT